MPAGNPVVDLSFVIEQLFNIRSDVSLCMKRSTNRQRVRNALIIFSFVLLPVTFAYISCPIITEGASEGIITGGLIVFILLFISSLFLGRLWCGWLCPMGGLQEIYFHINDNKINLRRLVSRHFYNVVKYMMY